MSQAGKESLLYPTWGYEQYANGLYAYLLESPRHGTWLVRRRPDAQESSRPWDLFRRDNPPAATAHATQALARFHGEVELGWAIAGDPHTLGEYLISLATAADHELLGHLVMGRTQDGDSTIVWSNDYERTLSLCDDCVVAVRTAASGRRAARRGVPGHLSVLAAECLVSPGTLVVLKDACLDAAADGVPGADGLHWCVERCLAFYNLALSLKQCHDAGSWRMPAPNLMQMVPEELLTLLETPNG